MPDIRLFNYFYKVAMSMPARMWFVAHKNNFHFNIWWTDFNNTVQAVSVKKVFVEKF